MYEAWCKLGPAEADIRSAASEKWKVLKLLVFAVLICEMSAWTYHYGSTRMTWEKARKWCESNYTNMVFIRNKIENKHLNETVPRGSSHYWIGIQKINGTWIWVENQKPVPEDVQIWASEEPNSKKEVVCVELYIRRTNDSGKWNDDPCNKPKLPLCYQVSCRNSTCHHGECMETIGNYTCECWPGFHGNNCEHAVSCKELQIPKNVKINCTDENGKYQYKSCCNFSCDEGYELNGTTSVLCQKTGEWSESTPTCLAVSCKELQIPKNVKINCTDENGKYQYKSCCNFSCDEGYELNGTTSVLCQKTGEWSESTPTCLAWNASFGKQKQVAIVSSVSGTVGLFLSGIPFAYLLSYLRKKKKENSHILKTNKEPANTFENPAFEDTEMNSMDL